MSLDCFPSHIWLRKGELLASPGRQSVERVVPLIVYEECYLSPCLDCGGEDIEVAPPPTPGQSLAWVRCLQCGTAVMGDTAERVVWIWNLPR